MNPKVKSLDHLVLTVADLDRTIAFYCGLLGMTLDAFRAADGTDRHAISFGTQKLNLHRAGHEFDPKAQRPTPGSADLCFLSDQPVELWRQHLTDHGVSVEQGPVARTGATGPILSVYVRDPDGNLIEISNRA